jgi:hypothetical protein
MTITRGGTQLLGNFIAVFDPFNHSAPPSGPLIGL